MFLSGASALAYELLWTRLLELSFGHTVYAFTAAVASFMLGSAVGSRWLGPLGDRWPSLRFYAVLEIGIGVAGLVVPSALVIARDAYLPYHAYLELHPALQSLVQFLSSAVVLGLPTTLMGATIPVAARGLLRAGENPSRTMATLFGVNTLGAAVGALGTGFLLLPSLGVWLTNCLAVALNLLVGVVLWLIAAGDGGPESVQANRLTRSKPDDRSEGVAPYWLLGFTGVATMIYEVTWTRALVAVIGNSVYAVTTILVVVLLGLALGNHLYRRFHLRSKALTFAWLQLGTALSAMLLIPFFHFLPQIFLVLFPYTRGQYAAVVGVKFAIAGLVILVPSAMIGMAFPCAAGLAVKEERNVSAVLGKLYGANTLGAVLGMLVTGFYLVPYWGCRRAVALGVVLNAALAAAVLWGERPRRNAAVVVGCSLLAFAFWRLPPWDPRLFVINSAVYADIFLQRGAASVPESIVGDPSNVLYFREGVGAVVAVVEFEDGYRGLSINGKIDAGDGLDMETQIKLAEVPMLLHPAPKKVAVVGLGSGVTAGVVTLFSELERVDVIELEPAVVDAARYFERANFGALQDPRLRVLVDDARTHLRTASANYDVIISEPSNPWMSGQADLFTEEFYRIARDRMAKGGIFCQWLQAYNFTVEDWRLILRTFQKVFPDSTLWQAMDYDYFILGRVGGGDTGLATLWSHLERSPELREAVPYLGESVLDDLLGSFVLDAEDIQKFAGLGLVNTDDLPLLQYTAPKGLYLGDREQVPDQMAVFRTRSHPHFLIDAALDTTESQLALIRYLMGKGRLVEADVLIGDLPELVPGRRGGEGPIEGPATSRERLALSFEAEANLPLHPFLGGAPENIPGDDAGEFGSIALKYLARVSGPLNGVGRLGGTGLSLGSVPGFPAAGYSVPVPVRPLSRYQLTVWANAEPSFAGGGGVGIAEFDVYENLESFPSSEFISKHLLRITRDEVRVEPGKGWREYRVAFDTSAAARMVHLILYREEDTGSGALIFDDLSWEPVRP